MRDQPLLIALVAVQFFVHALGWAMAAHLTQRWRATEGLFAVGWLLLASGLMLYVPPWAGGSAPRNLGDLLIVTAAVVQHAGMALYWDRRPPARAYLALLAFTAFMIALSLARDNDHVLRVANLCSVASSITLATVRLIWQRGRQAMPVFATVLAGSYGLLAVALLARAVQALVVGPGTKISIDAPGHSNVPFAILVMFVGGMINLSHVRLVLGRVVQNLTVQALTDALTGAVNRRGLMRQLEGLHASSRQRDAGYVMMMVDIDHFKAINDEHGHSEGDHVLKRVAQSLRDSLRAGDVVARWGGEEFCVLLPGIGLAEAQALAERVLPVVAASGKPRVTISIGLAEAKLASEGADAVIRRADAALYRAKKAGRNRVVAAEVIAPA